MYTLFVIIHVLVSLVLCVVVLLQSGKGGGLAGAFGGGGGAPQQMLGSRGMTTLLHKVTIWCGVGFMVTSLVLFMMSGTRTTGSGGVLEDAQQRGEFGQPAPTAPIEVPAETPPPTGGDADSGQDETSGGGGID
ncbi:preprotein translocase subunit SecG [bacterium]|nr:preprotein translocase subunit SecG [bacterium]